MLLNNKLYARYGFIQQTISDYENLTMMEVQTAYADEAYVKPDIPI